MSRVYRLRDDFIAPNIDNANGKVTSELNWAIGGTPGTYLITTTELGSPGILRMVTGGSINNQTSMSLASATAGMLIPANVESFKFRLRPTSTSNIRILFGLGEDLSSSTFGVSGIFFEFDSGTDSNVRSVARNASTSTETTVAALGTVAFAGFEFVRADTALWHSYSLTSNGRKIGAEHTANLPNTTAHAFGIRLETLTGAAKSVDIDLVEVNGVPLALR